MRRAGAAITVAVLLCVLGAQKGPTEPPTVSKEQWREDLKYFAKELPKRHMNLYHACRSQEFERAVAELDAAIPSLEDHQIVVRLQQIAARVGDGHTGVHLPLYFKLYPIAVYWFGGELRVTAATKAYERALGARVVQIGDAGDRRGAGARRAAAFRAPRTRTSGTRSATSPAFITVRKSCTRWASCPISAHAPFTFEDDEGAQFTLEVEPVDVPLAKGSAPAPG